MTGLEPRPPILRTALSIARALFWVGQEGWNPCSNLCLPVPWDSSHSGDSPGWGIRRPWILPRIRHGALSANYSLSLGFPASKMRWGGVGSAWPRSHSTSHCWEEGGEDFPSEKWVRGVAPLARKINREPKCYREFMAQKYQLKNSQARHP